MTVIRVPNAKETPPAAVRELTAKEMARLVGGTKYFDKTWSTPGGVGYYIVRKRPPF